MSDKPAFPFIERDEITDNGSTQNFGWYGLTRRELFAAMAMQGIQANTHDEVMEWNYEYSAQYAVNCADALIAALDAEDSA